MTYPNAVDFYGDGYYESGTAFQLKWGTGRQVRLNPTSHTTCDLPDARLIPNWGLGGPIWNVQNVSATFNITIRDAEGTTVATLHGGPINDEYDIVNVWLESNATEAGIWHFKEGVAGSAAAPGVEEKVYWLGGQTSTDANSDVVDEYDIEADTWALKSEASGNVKFAAGAVVNDKGYVHGGNLAGSLNNRSYDPGADLWADLADMPTGTGGQTIRHAASFGGDTYAFGLGTTGTPNLARQYDVSGDTWNTLASGTERADDGCSQTYVVEEKVYCYGVDTNGRRQRVYEYSIAANDWTRTADQTVDRLFGGVVDNEENDTSYLLRGSETDSITPTDRCTWHDMGSDTYTSKNDHPAAGSFDQGHARASARIFHGGGGLDTTWYEYIPVLDTFDSRATLPRNKDNSYDQCMGINSL